jgi:hypothetical protein
MRISELILKLKIIFNLEINFLNIYNNLFDEKIRIFKIIFFFEKK